MNTEAARTLLARLEGPQQGKPPFLTGDSGGTGDTRAAAGQLAERYGVPDWQDFLARVATDEPLTVAQYEKLGRAPYYMRPRQLVNDDADKFRAMVTAGEAQWDNMGPDIGFTRARCFDSMRLGALYSDHLKPDDPRLLNHTRLNVTKLIHSIALNEMMSDNCIWLINIAARFHWRRSRLANAILFVAVAPVASVKEYMTIMRDGGAGWTDAEYVAAFKIHHELLRSSRRAYTAQQVPVGVMADFLYMGQLIGRGSFFTQEDFDKDKAARVRDIPDYTAPRGADFATEARRLLTGAMRGTGEPIVGKSYRDFNAANYIGSPTGSTSMSRAGILAGFDQNDTSAKRARLAAVTGALRLGELATIRGLRRPGDIPDLRGPELQGAKRLYYELVPPPSLLMVGEIILSNSFLKMEAAKERLIYPTSAKLTHVCNYIAAPAMKAFFAMPGVDLGHTPVQSMALKFDVLTLVRAKMWAVNADGKGFNEGHSNRIQSAVRHSLTEAIDTHDPGAAQDIAQAHAVYDAAHETMTLTVHNPLTGQREVWVARGTLLSGELVTSIINTGILWTGAHLGVVELMLRLKVLVTLFLRGDDLNGFTDSWPAGVTLAKIMEEMGIELGKAKDYLANDSCDHERCLVTSTGYKGSLARRVGSMTPSEPQGSSALTIQEVIAWAYDGATSLVARGARPKTVDVVLDAALMTYENTYTPFHSKEMLGELRCVGGVGLWYTERADHKHRFAKYAAPKPITVDYDLVRDGAFQEFGSAELTDPLLTRLITRHPTRSQEIMGHRARLLGAAFDKAVGEARYGPRKRGAEEIDNEDANGEDVVTMAARHERERADWSEQVDSHELGNEPGELAESSGFVPLVSGFRDIVQRQQEEASVHVSHNWLSLNTQRVKEDMARAMAYEKTVTLVMNASGRDLAVRLGAELRGLMLDTASWRRESLITPSTLLLWKISEQDLVDLKMAESILAKPAGFNLYDTIVSHSMNAEQAVIVNHVRAITDEKLREAYYRDEVECVFWLKSEPVPGEFKGYLRQWMTTKLLPYRGKLNWHCNCRTMNSVCSESYALSFMSRVVYLAVADLVNSVSY